jgi:asparagine synthase (glutamine-hydrolysing)
MCGIAGIISRPALSSDKTAKVARANQLLAHRGPDGDGSYANEHVVLAMRRLSIIDLATGWQPLYNEDRSLVLIANGEIYNYIELRRDLERQGHHFRTGSDCETILHLYEQHGYRFVDYLRGMFAFALWDTRSRKLILGRDRIGEKPLYLAQTGDSLYFASELRALVQAGIVPFKLDPLAVHEYYHYGFVPEPRAMVQGVRKLPAASLLTVQLDSWTFDEQCYWRLEDAPPLTGNPAKIIRKELEHTATLITRADVPIGVALSGGVDASSVAALATSSSAGNLHAFTVGYAGRPWQDERNDASLIADYLKIPFHSVELSTSDMVEQFSSVNLNRDDPIADVAGVAIAAVANLARQHAVPVLLFGHGGDELFWGYNWVRDALRATRRRKALTAGLQDLRNYFRFSAPPLSLTLGLKWALSGAGILKEWQQYQSDLRAAPDRVVLYDSDSAFQTAEKVLRTGFYTRAFAHAVGTADLRQRFKAQRADTAPDVVLMRLISELYLVENGITQADRLCMAASVEARLPFVDYRLVETVVGLRKTYPFSDLEAPKQWLREAVSDLLPATVLARRKRGFSPPWRQWARAIAASHGHELTDGYLVQNGALEPAAAECQRKDLNGRLTGPRPLAGMSLCLENWCRQMVGGSSL